MTDDSKWRMERDTRRLARGLSTFSTQGRGGCKVTPRSGCDGSHGSDGSDGIEFEARFMA